MKKNKNILITILALALSVAFLMGCSPVQKTAEQPQIVPEIAESTFGGVLCLKINPEIALHYDENGKVTKLEARNPDGAEILKNFTGYEGKETAQVLEELVAVIGKAGYLVEEAEGKSRKIVLELDPGSQVPHDKFLEDMAAHVKKCVENKEWVGEVDFEYDERPVETTPAAPTTPAVKPEVKLCPICGDDDCDDGIYCDDADEKAENLREEQRKNTDTTPKPTTPVTKPTNPEPKPTSPATKPTVKLCPICGDDDCDDGIYCDDADEKAENQREQENRKNGTPCPICADYDCDDGIYCDDADEREENLREEERRKTDTTPTTPVAEPTTPETEPAAPTTKPTVKLCPICGDDDCDDGIYCDDADEKAENLREQENRENGTPCGVCGDYDCDDGIYCDDWDEKAENLREEENRKNGVRCEVCGDYDCDDGEYCDDWDERYEDDDD